MFVIQIAAFLRVRPYVYVTDAASPMFQRFELLFANKTVPRDSNSLETICLGSAGFQPAFSISYAPADPPKKTVRIVI